MSKDGQLQRLPLELESVAEFWEEVGNDPETWQWMAGTDPIPESSQALQNTFGRRMSVTDAEFFQFRDQATNEIVALSAFLDIREQDRHVEIGSTFIARRFRGGNTNYRMKLMMLTEAFDVRDCVRVTFKVNALNQRSRDAMLRIGATFEGELRNQREQRDGTWRTAVIYSIIDSEWPEVRQSLEQKIAS
jgi:N-acetyltransferase